MESHGFPHDESMPRDVRRGQGGAENVDTDHAAGATRFCMRRIAGDRGPKAAGTAERNPDSWRFSVARVNELLERA